MFIKEEMPSRAKNSDCRGTITEPDATRELIVKKPRAGGQSIIIPLQSEFFALEGISSLVNTIELIKENFNPKLTIEGILLTMVDKRNSLSSLVEKDVRNHFGETVYKTTIPRNVRISEAPSHGKPAILYDVNSSGSVAYIGLAREILEKQGLTNE